MVFLLLLVMTFGIVEYGLILRQLDDVADAVRAGTRAASQASKSTNADWQIISAMKDSNNGLAGKITEIVVFKADANGNPTATCANFVVQSGQCNVYKASEGDFAKDEAALIARASNMGGWRPADRTSSDYVGVRARAQYTWVTKFFSSVDKQLGDSATAKIEEEAPLLGNPGNTGAGWNTGSPTPTTKGQEIPKTDCNVCNGSGGSSGGANG